MKYCTLGHRLPRCIASPLFGDRKKFGNNIIENDNDWLEWEKLYLSFYVNTQKSGFGEVVNNSGYKVLSKLHLQGKKVLEIGPGVMPHCDYWLDNPSIFYLIDRKLDMLKQSEKILESKGIEFSSFLSTSHLLPIDNNSVDIVFSFYNLEHLLPLDNYLSELKRVLKPGGLLVGAIPCEGGMAWGLGRFLTSRRYVRKNSTVNYDKIICWEHPNFAEEILKQCDKLFHTLSKKYWPFGIPIIDANLTISFVYQKNYEE